MLISLRTVSHIKIVCIIQLKKNSIKNQKTNLSVISPADMDNCWRAGGHSERSWLRMTTYGYPTSEYGEEAVTKWRNREKNVDTDWLEPIGSPGTATQGRRTSCCNQCCGSKYTEFGSGSWILAQFESKSGCRVMLSILKENFKNNLRDKRIS